MSHYRVTPFRSLICLALAACGGGAAANAQVLIPTSQVREVRGEGTWTDASGTMSTGPLLTSAPADNFGEWPGSLAIPGFISGMGSQLGGFDGIDTITLSSVVFSLGGGNGPGTSAMASLGVEFEYTFDLAAPVTYVTSAGFGVAPPSGIPDTTADFSGVYTLSGPGGEVFRYETGPDNGYNVSVMDATGSLAAGSYTLSFVMTGDVSFVSPPDDPDGNGAGGGGGGPSPILVFRVEAGGCAADWNEDTVVNSNDISSYLTAWLADVTNGTTLADFDGGGQTNSNDISAFLTAWLDAVQNGC